MLFDSVWLHIMLYICVNEVNPWIWILSYLHPRAGLSGKKFTKTNVFFLAVTCQIIINLEKLGWFVLIPLIDQFIILNL